ncbi:hypothetical protein K8T06_04540 [bacterium]|nr:hypothetical protein [bacterium]
MHQEFESELQSKLDELENKIQKLIAVASGLKKDNSTLSAENTKLLKSKAQVYEKIESLINRIDSMSADKL